jgi:uncharacterized membrane protein
MFKFWLFLHLIALTIGPGTGIYLAMLARHAGQTLDQAQAKALMPGINRTVFKVGMMGLALLVVSGSMMLISMDTININTFFGFKLLLVAAIVVNMTLMNRWAKQLARSGDQKLMLRMKKAGKVGLTLSGGTILTAVLAFN